MKVNDITSSLTAKWSGLGISLHKSERGNDHHGRCLFKLFDIIIDQVSNRPF